VNGYAILPVALLAMLAAPRAVTPPPEITAKEIIEKVQAKYDDLTDATIQFTQSTRFKVSHAEQSVKGTLYFKKKSRYRIETDQRVIVTDGKTAWSHNLRTNQVLVNTYREETSSLSPERLLVHYPDDFYSAYVGEEKVGSDACYALTLTPKEETTFAASMKIWVTRQWTIKKVELSDVAGTVTTYVIASIAIDRGLPDAKFEFKPPPDASVIDLR
jgi:chaperone LolA